MKYCVAIILCFLFSVSLFSQSAKQYVKAGKKAYKQNKFETAVYYFTKALEIEKNASIAWYAADAARQNKQYDIAERWYQYVAENDRENYPLAYFWLGMMQKNLAKYQKAQISFRKYLQKNASKKDYYTLKSRHEILSCENALLLTFEKNDKPIFTFDSIINTSYSEFQAYIDKDSTLWITSYKPLENEDSINFTSKLITFTKNGETWQKSAFDTILNSPNTFISSYYLSNNKQKLVLSICQKVGTKYVCKLYKTEKNSDFWKKPELLLPVTNEPYNYTHPHIIENDTACYLIFASDRKGGYGKLDLWAVKLNDNLEAIDTIFNLGKKINSIDHECCPYYDIKNKILYFSSEWNTNLGGLDIFSSYGWIKNLYPPQNLGFPINTNHDEAFFQVSYHRDKAFFASNRSTHQLNSYERCCNDIFYFDFEKPVLDTVKKKEELQKKAHELIPVVLYFHNDEPNPRTWDTTTQYTYSQLYDQYIQKRDEFIKMYSSTLKSEEKTLAEAKIDAFFTEEVEKNYLRLIQFFNILKQLLEKGDTIYITIKGYASPLNNHAYNLNLSKRRVQSLINLLHQYQDGVFIPYINQTTDNGGRLVIVREAFGENMVKEGVSDDLRDLRRSVYSPEASRERKIAVIAIKFE